MSSEGARQRRSARGLSQRIARWLSAEHRLGRALLAARMRAQLALWRPSSAADVALKRTIARLAPEFTMVDLPRLRHLAHLVREVQRHRIPGAIVECGTWRGGGLALVAWLLREAGDGRHLWGFDSFEGLPPPGGRDGAGVHRRFFAGWCGASEDDVARAVATVGGAGGRLHIVKGWLRDTLPKAATGPIALLNVDVDWYESVRTTLDTLFDRVSPGGFINIDDYGRWPGCDAAVHDFFRERGLPSALLRRTGRHGASFRK